MATRRVGSVEKGGVLLRYLAARQGRPTMLRDLAKSAGVSPNVAHAYLASFRQMELVEQDGATGFYRLGPFALTLGLAYLRGRDALSLIHDALYELHEQLGQTVCVAMTIWTEDGPIVLRAIEPSLPIIANIRPGSVLGMTKTATGRMFAAFMPPVLVDPVVRRELEAFQLSAAEQRRTVRELADGVEQARLDGFSRSLRATEFVTEIAAAPVFDHEGALAAGITLFDGRPSAQAQPGSPEVEALLSFARQMSVRLGYGASLIDPGAASG